MYWWMWVLGAAGLVALVTLVAAAAVWRRRRAVAETTGPMYPSRLYLPSYPAPVRYLPPEDPARWPTRRSWSDDRAVPGAVADGGASYGGDCASSGDGGGAVGGCE